MRSAIRRSLLVVLSCGVVAAATVGCSGPPSTATAPVRPSVGIAQLRDYFRQARAVKKTVTMTARGQEGPDPLGQDCQVQYFPSSASTCYLTRRAEHMGLITLPQASYVTTADGGDPPTWRKLDPHDTDMSDFYGVLAQIVGAQAGIADDVVLTPGVSTLTNATPEQVDGVAATRYDLTVDGRALYAAMARQVSSDSFREALQDLESSAGPTVAQVWIGPDNLPVRQLVREPRGKYGSGEPETITYSGWGTPVNIQPPPANEVTG